MSVFSVEHANLGYNGEAVLRDVSLSIDAGEHVALVGKSGAGKSTLLKLLFERRRTNTALIPQELGLVRPLSVFHNIYMGRLHVHATVYNLINLIWPLRREVEAIRRIVARLELDDDKLFEPVGQLSGGQQQRTAVARAIHQGSQVLLGDEPVASVDEHQSRVVLESINAAHETVVLSMHDVDLALAYSDRVIGLKNGQIALDHPAADIQARDLDFLYQNA